MTTGQTAFSKGIHLEKGTCLGVHFVPIDVDTPKVPVEIGIDNSQGGVLLSPTDYRDYVHKEGGYFNGMKQVNFPTNNNTFYVKVSTERPLSADFVGQLIFTIQRDCE